MVLRIASVATWSLSLRSPCPMVRAECDRRHFHHAQESRRQVALNVFPENAGLAFRTSLRSHLSSLPARCDDGIDAPG